MQDYKKIIYISSFSHSGSTLLDLIMGSHPKMIGLGEIFRCLNLDTLGKDCSCGQSLDQCEFWGIVNSKISSSPNLNFNNKFDIILDTFYEIYNDEIMIVDSSKYSSGLKYYIENNYDIKVLRLVKDVRAFTTSQIKLAKYLNKGIKYRSGIYHHIKWYLGNRKFDKMINENNIKVYYVSYENLCLQQERTINDICKFLNLDYDNRMLSIGESNSHILRGNRMRNEKKKKTEIQYDYRWFNERSWVLPYALFPQIRSYNDMIISKNSSNIFDFTK